MTAVDFEPCDPAEVGMSASRLQRAVELMEHQFATGRSPMLVALVARHGRVVLAHAIGDQRPGGVPLRVDHVFPMSSNGKPVVAATLLALVERGMVGLNESITDHVPSLRRRDHGEVMVHHLLTHTSGWDDDAFTAAVGEVLAEGVPEPSGGRSAFGQVLLEAALRTPRHRAADTVMHYATMGYTLLGEIIRNVTGTTVDAAARRYVLDPVGMTKSAFIVPDDLEAEVIERPPGIPFAPDHADTVIVHAEPGFRRSDDAGMGLHSTAPDLLRFQQMILHGGTVGERRVLSRDAVRVMTTNQIPGVSGQVLDLVIPEASWGFGYSVGGTEALPRWRGGTAARGAMRHGGAGGIASMIDPTLGLNAAYFEMVTEWSERAGESWAPHRFEDIVTAAVVD